MKTDYDRLNEMQIATILAEIPDIRKIKTVTLLDNPHRDQNWARFSTGDIDIVLPSEVDELGNIILYRADDRDLARSSILSAFVFLLSCESGNKELMSKLGDLESITGVSSRSGRAPH